MRWTTTIAFVLSFGAGAIWGQTMGYLGVFIFAPVIWLVGAAIKYKLGGGPFGSSW